MTATPDGAMSVAVARRKQGRGGVTAVGRSTGGSQFNKLAIVIASHLDSGHHFVILAKKVEDVYLQVRESSPEPFEGPFNFARSERDALFGPF